MRRILPHLLLASAIAIAAAPAAAQPRERSTGEKAQALFDTGLKFMEKGDYATACPLLEQSERLDPGMGTRFRLAECWEHVGKLASAHRMFSVVADNARLSQSPERERVARQRAEAIAPKLSKLLIRVPPRVGTYLDVVVTRNGAVVRRDLWDTAFAVDPGEQKVEIRARGKTPHEATVTVDKPGETFTVELPDLQDAPVEEKPVEPVKPEPVTPEKPAGPPFVWTSQHTLAAVAGGVGLAGVIVGGIFGSKASSQWSDAQDGCEGGRPDRCTSAAVALGDDASASATVSTIAIAVGLAGLGAGAFLWFTAPSAAAPAPAPAAAPAAGWQLAPVVGPGLAGGAVRARF